MRFRFARSSSFSLFLAPAIAALSLLLAATGCAPTSTTPPAAGGQFKLVKTFHVGGDGRWDYVTVDPDTGRLYVPRSDRVMVVNADDGSVVGVVPDTKGVHGVALVPELGRGFTSNGADASVTIFDLKTLQTLGTVKAGDNPDAIIYDPASKRIFTFNGRSQDLSAIDASIDPATGKLASRLALGGKPEFAVADGEGNLYVNIEDTNEVVHVDSKALKVLHRWPLAPGEEPTGLAMDAANRRLFVGCHNKLMVVMNADTGKVVTALPIGEGVDAVAFDPKLGLAFASCGDGTLRIVKEQSPDRFEVVQTVPTQHGARTMALDTTAHRLYLPTAEFAPPLADTTQSSRRPSMIPGSFVILVVERR